MNISSIINSLNDVKLDQANKNSLKEKMLEITASIVKSNEKIHDGISGSFETIKRDSKIIFSDFQAEYNEISKNIKEFSLKLHDTLSEDIHHLQESSISFISNANNAVSMNIKEINELIKKLEESNKKIEKSGDKYTEVAANLKFTCVKVKLNLIFDPNDAEVATNFGGKPFSINSISAEKLSPFTHLYWGGKFETPTWPNNEDKEVPIIMAGFGIGLSLGIADAYIKPKDIFQIISTDITWDEGREKVLKANDKS